MSLEQSAFHRLTALVTANDIRSELLRSAVENSNAYEAYMEAVDSEPETFDSVALVEKDGVPVGWWSPFETDVDEKSSNTVGQLMDRIPLSMIVSSDTSYYDLADAFARRRHPFFFVVDGAAIAGWVSYHGLFSRVGQMCLLSLTLFLEAVSEELCALRAKDCWPLLPSGRQRKAEEVCALRYGQRMPRELDESVPLPLLIRCTTFIDKGTMLSRADLVNGVAKKAVVKVFSTAEKVRNLCAHGGNEHEFVAILPQKQFSDFLHRTQEFIQLIIAKT
jgi:hypothetical protein